MAKLAGVDVILKVKGEGETELVALAGQTGTDLDLTAETIDVTDKNSQGWVTSMAGLKSWSLSSDGFVDLGEPSLKMLRKHFIDRKPIHVEIRVGEKTSEDGVTFKGLAYITSLPHGFQQDDAVTYSVDLQGGSPLEVLEGKDETGF